MGECNKSVGVRSFATIQVYRHGKLREEIKDCGNDILDNWFAYWGSVGGGALSGVLKLGENGDPTLPSMTALGAAKKLVGINAYGYPTYATATGSHVVEDIAGKNYVTYSFNRVFTYAVGQWVGVLRELGMHSNGSGNDGTTAVNTRILIPSAPTITSEDQLIITYTWKVRVLNEITTETISAVYNGVPTDVVVTCTPGPFNNAIAAVDNFLTSPGHTSSDILYCNTVAVGAINAPMASPKPNISGFTKVTTYDPIEKTRNTLITIPSEKANYVEEALVGLGYCSSSPAQKWSFNPPIPKTDKHITRFTLVTKVERL